jgi:hypothetical protein
MAKKFDGVIEAVRYTRKGQIDLVRAYERRGATFSDRVLLERKVLLERIRDGKVFFTGKRKQFWASTFETGKQVLAIQKNGKEFLTTRENLPEHDELEETPAF